MFGYLVEMCKGSSVVCVFDMDVFLVFFGVLECVEIGIMSLF